MNRRTKTAIRHVLRASSKTRNFFDLSDSERLVRMIGMGFEPGSAQQERKR